MRVQLILIARSDWLPVCPMLGTAPVLVGPARWIIKRLVSKGNVINVAADPN